LLGISALGAADAGPKFLYTLHNNQALRGFAINSTTGALTPLPGSPQILPELTKATGDVAFEPTGHFVYATSGGTAHTIAALSFNATTGVLTRSSTVATGALSTSALAMDPAGKFLIAVQSNLSSTTTAPIQAASYVINGTTGALTLASGPVTLDADSPVEDLAIAGTP
jgi:6-phosphogluconolactonase (cycloisomerase 2 family)